MRFNAALVKWLESASDVTGDVISIDGKLPRRALTKDGKMPCIASAHDERARPDDDLFEFHCLTFQKDVERTARAAVSPRAC